MPFIITTTQKSRSARHGGLSLRRDSGARSAFGPYNIVSETNLTDAARRIEQDAQKKGESQQNGGQTGTTEVVRAGAAC
jgi:hypothetical protein